MGAPTTGSVIAGRYRLGEMIGEGGMARVFCAFDVTLEREVAVKFLFLREGRERETMVARFLREARIAAAVRHPNVVDLIDFGTTEDERPYMVLELLEGESLEARLSRPPTMTLEELVRITAAILDGLAAVHKAGIVHRDLKPDNVFLLEEGDGEVRPKLLDFGVSRDTDPTSGRRSALTTTDGYLVGTPEYMSPEQARGLSDIDHRSDLYSVGVVLYEAMSGQLPYDAEAVGDLIIDIVQGGAPPVATLRPEIGGALSAVIERAMASRREDRFSSAREMRDALLLAAEGSLGISVRPSLPTLLVSTASSTTTPSVPPRAPRPDVPTMDGAAPIPLERPGETPRTWTIRAPERPARSRTAAWAAAAALLAIGGGAAAFWLADRDARVVEGSVSAVAIPREGAIESAGVVEPSADALVITPPPPAPERIGAAATVTVSLRGLPANARVSVDGAWVEVEGEALTLPRDGAPHRVTVVAPGRRPWRLTHVADADASYRVRLRRGSPDGPADEADGPEPVAVEEASVAAEAAAPAAETAPPAQPVSAPSEPATAIEPTPEPAHEGVFRDLDY